MSHEQILATLRAERADLERTLSRSASANVAGILVSAALGATVAIGAAYFAFRLFY